MYNRIINRFVLCLLSYISFTNSIIEIPLKPIQVEGIPKYSHFKLPVPEDILEENEDEFEPKLLIEQGNSIINANNLFVATVKIGSLKQPFNFLLDTGSSVTWVPKKGSIDKWKKEHYYEPTTSTTSRKTNNPFQIKYGSGSCSGFYYYDIFNYINNKNFRLKFGVALKTDFNVNGADGIIGLSHFYDNEDLSFINMLNKGGVTKSKIFSLKFGFNIKTGKVGTLYIGKHNDFSNKNTVTCPLVKFKDKKKIFWICNIKSFGIKNYKYTKSYDIMFDTETNMILLPLEYYYYLKNQVGALNCQFITNDQKAYRLMCQTESLLPDFRFEINGHILIIPKNYGFNKASNGIFLSKVVFVESNHYIIGTPFFFAFHTLFDKVNEQLHFYPEKPEFMQKTNLR